MRKLVVALAGVAFLAGAGSASAGSYQVRIGECAADRSSPFELSADLGMEALVDCDEQRVVARTGDATSVPEWSSATARLSAPAGTTFESIDWNGGYERFDCRWDAQLTSEDRWAVGLFAFRECEAPRWLDEQRIELDRAKFIALRVSCRDPEGCPVPPPDSREHRSARGAAVSMWGSTVTVDDPVPPSLAVDRFDPPDRPWVRGVRPLRFDAQDNTGIRETRLTIAGRTERHLATCDDTRLVPCPPGGKELPVDTTQVADGLHWVTIDVLDAGSNRTSDSMRAYVDNTPPEPVQPYVDGGSGWHRDNAFAVSWSAQPERYAPIAATHYRLCRAETSECMLGTRKETGIAHMADFTVPEPGEWTVSVWREDEAGNVDEGRASAPVRLRFDGTPPALAFERRRLDDPRRVSVAVSDGVSGVAGGEIQLRPAIDGTWRSLPTRLEGGRLTAEVDDDRLPAGTYELRALARDHAGNESSTNALADGSAALLQLPLRARARLKARVVPAGKARFGAKVRIEGRLTNELGRPVRGARLYVSAQSRGGRERPGDAATANGAGKFTYVLRARASGTVRIRYDGSKLLGAAQQDLPLEVPAAAVLTTSHRRALNGQSVIFRGHLRGRPFPAKGKIIQLQAYDPREGWRSFGASLRADRNGRWRVPYPFNNTRGVVKYKFRILVPREADYPFETGASNVVRVTVRGR